MLVVAIAWGTTAHEQDVKCPVCSTTFQVAVMMSTNTAGGSDRDFCRHAGGTDPVILAIAACPKCHYANYADALTEKKPPKVSPELKKAILAGQLRVPAHEPRRPDFDAHAPGDIPAWVAYDLRAQICRLKPKPDPEELLMLYLNAAWSLRSEDNPFHGMVDEAAAKVLEGLFKDQLPPKPDENPADLRLKLARQFLARLEGLAPAQQPPVAAWIGYTLREHGENLELLKALPSLQKFLPSDRLEERVKKTVEREQNYQKLALKELARQPKAENQANLLYLKGELHRRLGQNSEARGAYQQASQKSPPDWLKVWIREQTALCGEP